VKHRSHGGVGKLVAVLAFGFLLVAVVALAFFGRNAAFGDTPVRIVGGHGATVAASNPSTAKDSSASASSAAGVVDNPQSAAEDHRLADATRYLASPQLEGRGLGTRGLELAGDFIARQFKRIGLKTDLYDGQPFEPMTLPLGSEIGPKNHNRLEFSGPPKEGEKDRQVIPLEVGTDFNPLAVGGSKTFDAPAVFVGYGITAAKEKYDDYGGIEAKGKVVVILRHQPQRANPHGLFGDHDSLYAEFSRKISNAVKHGAAAIVFCNDFDEIRRSTQTAIPRPSAESPAADATQLAADVAHFHNSLREQIDPLRGTDRAGDGEDDANRLPVVFCHRDVVNKLVRAATGFNLSSIEQKIDHTGKPQSRDLGGWRISGETDIVRKHTPARNVLALLEGDGPHADETIIIGAHYDHLGYGGFGSLAPEAVHVIHPGADDNASGTAALIEVARRLALQAKAKKFSRRFLFMSFTGEERGLLGSARYVRDPLIPLDKTVAMLNMDMVGRMKDNKLTVYGVDTATEFAPLLTRLDKPYGFKIVPEMGGFGPSDHASFYAKKIPVLFFFTGLHADYHRPTDTADKLDVRDMGRVADFVSDVAAALAEAPARPHFFESQAHEHMAQQSGDRPYFGSIPDFGVESPGGYAISGVTKGGPADVAGLKGGDVITRLGDTKISGLEDFDSALREHRAGDKVPVRVKRDGKELQLEVRLEPPR
jgi:hypothetical protein